MGLLLMKSTKNGKMRMYNIKQLTSGKTAQALGT